MQGVSAFPTPWRRGLGPAKVTSQGFGDHGKAVVERSPRTDLADAQAGDEQPQAGPCRPVVCLGPSTPAGGFRTRASVGALGSHPQSLDLFILGGPFSTNHGDLGTTAS